MDHLLWPNNPMSPRDRLHDRCIVKYVNYKTNYCRFFQAKTKDADAQRLKQYMPIFGRQLNSIYVLRSEGDDEYRSLGLCCKDIKADGQFSEPKTKPVMARSSECIISIFLWCKAYYLQGACHWSFGVIGMIILLHTHLIKAQVRQMTVDNHICMCWRRRYLCWGTL